MGYEGGYGVPQIWRIWLVDIDNYVGDFDNIIKGEIQNERVQLHQKWNGLSDPTDDIKNCNLALQHFLGVVSMEREVKDIASCGGSSKDIWAFMTSSFSLPFLYFFCFNVTSFWEKMKEKRGEHNIINGRVGWLWWCHCRLWCRDDEKICTLSIS